MSKKRRVVILFPCVGRRVVLVQEFRRACQRLGLEAVVVGTDTALDSAALYGCDRRYIVKPTTDPGYERQLLRIVKREQVDLVVPTLDPDLPHWAALAPRLQKQKCHILVSTPEIVHICQDKRLMYRYLKANGFDTPETMSAVAARRLKRPHFPYFLKPWDGSASKGNKIVRDREALEFFSRRIPHCIVQECVAGAEHTVDVLVDFQGQVRCVVPRRRIQTRAGEVSKGITAKHEGVIAAAKKLVESLGAGPGIITIQCFLLPDGGIKFIEINPRFGGGVPLSIKAGADFPRWILQWWLGQAPRIQLTGWRDQLLMLRYDEAVWVQK